AAGTNAASTDEIATGNLNYNFGGDGPAASQPFAWSGTVGVADAEPGDPAYTNLTSGGSPIVLSVSNGRPSITRTVNGGAHNGGVVAKLQITNFNTGAYTFEQLGAIDHPDHGQSGHSDDVNLTFNYTVKDSTGDTATATLKVSVGDDAPDAHAETK